MEITPFGEAVRQLRLKCRVRLKDMAKAMGFSQAYLSAVETGRKPLSDEVLSLSIQYFVTTNYLAKTGSEFDPSILRIAADQTRSELKVDLLGPSSRALVGQLVRHLEFHQGDAEAGEVARLMGLLGLE